MNLGGTVLKPSTFQQRSVKYRSWTPHDHKRILHSNHLDSVSWTKIILGRFPALKDPTSLGDKVWILAVVKKTSVAVSFLACMYSAKSHFPSTGIIYFPSTVVAGSSFVFRCFERVNLNDCLQEKLTVSKKKLETCFPTTGGISGYKGEGVTSTSITPTSYETHGTGCFMGIIISWISWLKESLHNWLGFHPLKKH